MRRHKKPPKDRRVKKTNRPLLPTPSPARAQTVASAPEEAAGRIQGSSGLQPGGPEGWWREADGLSLHEGEE